jgi:hypothetical protein
MVLPASMPKLLIESEYNGVGVIESEVEAANVVAPPLTEAGAEESSQQTPIDSAISSATAEIEEIIAKANRHTAEETEPNAPIKEAIETHHGLPETTEQPNRFEVRESRTVDPAGAFDVSQPNDNKVGDIEVASLEVESSIITEESHARETQTPIDSAISSATAEIQEIIAEANRHTAEETEPSAPIKEAIETHHELPETTEQPDQFEVRESRTVDPAGAFDVSQSIDNKVGDIEVASLEVESSIITERSDEVETDTTDVVTHPIVPQNEVDAADTVDSQAFPTRKKAAPRYQPRVRTAQSTTITRDSRKQERRAEAQRAQTLQMAVRAVADRRQRYTISLLPERIEKLGEEIKVIGPNGTEVWTASWDHWYGGASANNIGGLLENGNRWELQDNSESVNWVLSGRQVYVLGPSQTINALVIVPTLILNETHVVLCTQSQAVPVAAALRNAGCTAPTPAETGAPVGWVLFKDIRPTVPVLHEEAVGILNALRPIHDVEIVFRGGIRLNYSTWLNGHPPRIRIRGNTAEDVEVHIDGSLALRDADGNFTARGWDRPGFHTVFCGGVTQTYDLQDGEQSWETFEAFTYRSIQSRTTSHPILVCGPLVAAGNDATLSLTPTGNTCVLGAVPGEIAFLPPRDLRTSERVAVTSFSAVWSLPANALTCDKSVARIQLLRPDRGATALPALMRGSHGTGLWSQTILDASRKRLLVEPRTEEALHLWAQYVQVARQLRKRQR